MIVRRGLAALVLGGMLLAWPAHALASSASGTDAPRQYTGRLDAIPDPAIGHVLTIAHNAGDSPSTTRGAVAHNAGAVEIDVTNVDGRLVARHGAITPMVGDWLPIGHTVGQVWDGLGSGRVLLDLKSTTASALRLVVAEINRHPGSDVLVSTPSRQALETLQRATPGVTRLLTVWDNAGLSRLLADRGLLAVVQGVSIRQAVLTADTMASLHQAGLFVQAWTVNTVARLNQLAGWGLDGVTTENLTLLDAVAARAAPVSTPTGNT